MMCYLPGLPLAGCTLYYICRRFALHSIYQSPIPQVEQFMHYMVMSTFCLGGGVIDLTKLTWDLKFETLDWYPFWLDTWNILKH